MRKMRRAIGLNLQRSKQTIPHFYVRMTIDAGPLSAYYREQKPQTNCTLNDCVVLAVGRAMAEFPGVRSQLDGDEIIEYPHANIGIAVGVEDGLVVPVVRNVESLTLAQLAAEAKRVVENARNGKLENIGQGNFTVTNLGMFGVEEFSAIINPPEAGILAVSALREAVIVENGAIRPARVMTMTLSVDHRVVDGLLAAKFLGRLKQILENPAQGLN
jgi:pyruvate dehydrogenase E2 component (dihydrolipoamide acetyltransferase)